MKVCYVVNEEEMKEIVDTYILPEITEEHDIVVGVLNAGKPIADYVSEKLELPVDYVKCERTLRRTRKISGKKEYGKNPLFVDDVCSSGGTVAGLKKLYTGNFAALIGKLNLFQPTSVIDPWTRYTTPDQLIIGAISEKPITVRWEGEKYPLPKPEIDQEIKIKAINGEFYSTQNYHRIQI